MFVEPEPHIVDVGIVFQQVVERRPVQFDRGRMARIGDHVACAEPEETAACGVEREIFGRHDAEFEAHGHFDIPVVGHAQYVAHQPLRVAVVFVGCFRNQGAVAAEGFGAARYVERPLRAERKLLEPERQCAPAAAERVVEHGLRHDAPVGDAHHRFDVGGVAFAAARVV